MERGAGWGRGKVRDPWIEDMQILLSYILAFNFLHFLLGRNDKNNIKRKTNVRTKQNKNTALV